MPPRKRHSILFYKPYGVLSQCTKEGRHKTLRDFGPFPKDVYPAGRLDADSEGLLLLTDDSELNHVLTDPVFGHPRTYVVQVEGIPSDDSLRLLREGVVIQGRKTRPAELRLLSEIPNFPNRTAPIRFRKSIPTSWIEVVLREGRNRQVRKMTAAVGYPTLRLVRTKIGSLTLDGLHPGQWRELNADEVLWLKRSTVKGAGKRSRRFHDSSYY